MSSIGKVIATSVGAAAAVVLMYSPQFLGLTPFDPSILRASMSVIGGTFVAGVSGYSYWKALTPERKPSYERMEESSDTEDVSKIFDRYANDDVLSKYADTGNDQLRSADRKLNRAHDMLASRFGSSMTGTSFSSTVYTAISTVKRNCATLANDLQTFDTDEYEENKSAIVSGRYRYDSINDDVQRERYDMYQSLLQRMDDILSANERLLLEIDKVTMSLNDASSNATDDAVMVEELRDMTRRLKFYNDAS